MFGGGVSFPCEYTTLGHAQTCNTWDPYGHVQTCSLGKWVVGLRLKGLLVQTYTLAQPLFNGQPVCKNFLQQKGIHCPKEV